MQARPIVIAQSIHIAVVGFGVVAREDLGAGAASERVSKAAGAVVRVGSRITASACCCHSTRIAHTVVDVIAGRAIPCIARWAGITCETRGRRRLVVAVHFRMVEAWAAHTAVRIRT